MTSSPPAEHRNLSVDFVRQRRARPGHSLDWTPARQPSVVSLSDCSLSLRFPILNATYPWCVDDNRNTLASAGDGDVERCGGTVR